MRRRVGNAVPSAVLTLGMAAWLAVHAPQPARAGLEAGEAAAPANAVSLFGARMTDNRWQEIFLLDDIRTRGAWLAGAGLSRRIAEPFRGFSLEAEGQVVRHFGEQRHWEFNAALTGRWSRFPWDGTLPTSVAWGIGPSYATRIPVGEARRAGSSQRLMVYWVAELEVGLPERDWSTIARIHHRSGAFGIVADEGGSNWLTLGVRRRF